MGHNFADPIPLDDLPTNMEARGSLAGASLTSKFQTLPGVSSAFSDIYEEYVPRPVPRAPRSGGIILLLRLHEKNPS